MLVKKDGDEYLNKNQQSTLIRYISRSGINHGIGKSAIRILVSTDNVTSRYELLDYLQKATSSLSNLMKLFHTISL